MLLTMGKAGGIISKLSPKNMGNAAMAVRPRTMITEQYNHP